MFSLTVTILESLEKFVILLLMQNAGSDVACAHEGLDIIG